MGVSHIKNHSQHSINIRFTTLPIKPAILIKMHGKGVCVCILLKFFHFSSPLVPETQHDLTNQKSHRFFCKYLVFTLSGTAGICSEGSFIFSTRTCHTGINWKQIIRLQHRLSMLTTP